MINLDQELADSMQERNIDLGKDYGLINGGKISKGIKTKLIRNLLMMNLCMIKEVIEEIQKRFI